LQLKTSLETTPPGKERPLLAPIDLAKFLRQRYVDPGSTYEPESAPQDSGQPANCVPSAMSNIR